jgi:hypothetical protein
MMQFKRLGWHGIVLSIPWDWEVTSESGGKREAYFRLDDATQSRMEVKWEHMEKAGPLTLILDNLIEKLKKDKRQLRKAKILTRGSSKICGHTGSFITWQNGAKALATAWHCDETERLYLIQFFYKPEEQKAEEELIEDVLKSAVCHSDDEVVPWTVLDVQFEIPKDLLLESRKLLVGRVHMLFSSKDMSLLLDWHGFAEGLLERHGSLRKWFEGRPLQDVSKNLKIKLPSAEEADGTALNYKASQKTSLIGGSSTILGRVWMDAETNKLFSAFLKCGEKAVDPEGDFERIIGSFRKVTPISRRIEQS